MARELRFLILALLGTVLLFSVITTMLPQQWEVRRTANLPAPPARVVAEFADFANWQRWSPIARTGRTSTRMTIDGQAGKPGHQLTWEAGPSRAVLRMEAVDDTGLRLVFLSRLSADSEMVEYGRGTISVTPAGDGKSSDVVWLEQMRTVGVFHRWFAWFGVQQKTQGEQLEASFAQLRSEFERQ